MSIDRIAVISVMTHSAGETVAATGSAGMRCVRSQRLILERGIARRVTCGHNVGRRWESMTAVAAGRFKTTGPADAIVLMTGTAIINQLIMSTTAAAHGIGVAMTLFAITTGTADNTIRPGRVRKTK